MNNHIGYSREREMAERAKATASPQSDVLIDNRDIDDAISALEKASDSKGMSEAILRPTFKRLMIKMREDKVGASDMLRILQFAADRVDGKVSDRVEVVMTMKDEALAAVRELVLAGVLSRAAGREQLAGLGIIDVDFEEVV